MLEVDLRNAFEPGSNADNFSVLLLRLIAKADGDNKLKLSLGYPVHVKAVWIYQNQCPYRDMNRSVVDWAAIATQASEGKDCDECQNHLERL